MPRLYLNNFNHGVAVSSKYELLDNGPQEWSIEMNRGLIRYDRSAKPGFVATKNLIALLSDRGNRFAPGVLNYSLSGNTSNVSRVLMQKRDGSYYLALWVAKPRKDATPQAVTITVPTSVGSAAVAKPNDGQTWRPLADRRQPDQSLPR